jgi:MFS family permease
MKDLADRRVGTGGTVAARPAVTSRFSLWWRAIIAILLIIGYYAFSAAVIVGLLALAIASLHYGWGGAFVAVGGFIAAVAIFISILPHFDRYKRPGVRLKPESQPRLFEAISTVARNMGQRMPDAV